MKAFLVEGLIALFGLQPTPVRLIFAVPPVPPLNSPSTSVVVLNVTINSAGDPQQVATVAGASPFFEASLDAVKEWKFSAADDSDIEHLVNVTFLYRPRQIFNSGSGIQLPESPVAGNRPASPTFISDVAYPVDSIAEGVVILELMISPYGVIEQINTVRDVPSLTVAARRAVAAWKFSPAISDGSPVPGISIVAISFLRPITN